MMDIYRIRGWVLEYDVSSNGWFLSDKSGRFSASLAAAVDTGNVEDNRGVERAIPIAVYRELEKLEEVLHG